MKWLTRNTAITALFVTIGSGSAIAKPLEETGFSEQQLLEQQLLEQKVLQSHYLDYLELSDIDAYELFLLQFEGNKVRPARQQEYNQRVQNLQDNLTFIRSENEAAEKKGESLRLGITAHADLTREEYSQLLMKSQPDNSPKTIRKRSIYLPKILYQPLLIGEKKARLRL